MDHGKNSHELSDYLPLIGAFSTVVVAATLSYFLLNASGFMAAGGLFMSFFFVVFGSFKVYNLEGFVDAFQSYDPLAKKSKGYATVYPFLEIGLAAFYLSSVLVAFSTSVAVTGFLLTIALMGLNGAGVLNELAKGKKIQCACLGAVFNVPMTWVTLGEDLLMAGMALAMLLLTV